MKWFWKTAPLKNVKWGDKGWDLGHIHFLACPEYPDQRFWIASDHSGLMGGKQVIASPVPEIYFDPEAVKNRMNTLIGMIRDGACQVFASYEIPELQFLPKETK